MQKPKADDNEFVTTSTAARDLGVSGQSVIQWEREGKLKAVKTANGWRLFRREEIERMKAERARTKRA